MAGNTGKLTAENLEARGPRMRLLTVRRYRNQIGMVIAKEGQEPFRDGIRESQVVHQFGTPTYASYSSSYTLGYLLRIAKAMRVMA